MLIRLQLEHRLWRVLHPDKLESFRFPRQRQGL